MDPRYIEVPVNRVFLRTDNPRFNGGPVENEAEAIEKLCSEDDVLALATDIADVGLNPMDVAGVMKADANTYITGEGNRRFCALKLLNDPERAPQSQRKAFQKLAESSRHNFENVVVYEFEDKELMEAFIRRMHGAMPVRRRRWTPEAQEREFQTGKYALAVALNDFAVKYKIYKSGEDAVEISTLQRWAEKPGMKATLGITGDKSEPLRFRSIADTKKAVRALLDAIALEENPSRRNKGHIEMVAGQISSALGLQTSSGKAKPLSPAAPPTKTAPAPPVPRVTPKPPVVKTIAYDKELAQALEESGHHKLSSLYYSLTKTNLKDNVPMLSVTAWSLIECVCNVHGKNGTTSFPDYLTRIRVSGFGLCTTGKRDQAYKKFQAALSNISVKGNATKHELLGAGWDAHELSTDVVVLTPLLKALALDFPS
jgi:hypothetical protein